MEKRILTKEEVLALETILIEGNERIRYLRYFSGYRGLGGSNGYGTFDESITYLDLEELAGQKPIKRLGLYVRAVVCDVVYLSTTLDEKAEVISFDEHGDYGDSGGCAYDTEHSWRISPESRKW